MTQRVVNYTYGTGNPVLPDGSIDVRDGIDNLQSFDVFMNADEDTYNQRDGEIVKTRSGAVRAVGIQRIGDFTAGCTVTERNQGVLYETDGTVYVWLGALPKVVPAASSPATTGGVSPDGDWLYVGDASLRSQLSLSDGGSLVGYGTGTVKSALDYIMMSYPLDATDYLPDGYVTDGSVSYTTELQQALNDAAGGRAVLLPNFQVLIDPVGTTYGGLQVPSNSKVVFQIGSSLKIKPNNLPNYEIIGIRDKLNVEVFNAVLYGDKYAHTGTTGEFGMGIAIRGVCENIKIHNPRIYDCWGDGIYIGQTSNDISSTPKNVTIQSPRFYNCRRQGISVISADGLFIDDMGVWDTKSSDSPTLLPGGPHAGIDIEPNGSFSMLRNIRITGLHGGGNDGGLFYVFLGAITNTADNPYHVDIAVDGVSDDGSICAVQLTGLNKDANYSGSIKISNVSSDNAKLNGIRVRNWPIQCGLQATIDGVSISDWLSSPTEPARSRAAITSYTTEAGFPALGNLAIKGITLRQSRPAADVSERAFHGENASNGLSNISLEFDYVKSTVELKCISDGLVHTTTTGDYGSGLRRTITGSLTLQAGEVCDYIVAPSGANPTVTMSTFTAIRTGQIARLQYAGGGTSTGFRLRTAIGVPMFVNGVSGTNFTFYKTSGVVELTYADGAFVVRCDGEHLKES